MHPRVLGISGVSDKGAFLPSLDEHSNVRNIKDQIKQLQDRDTRVMLSLGGADNRRRRTFRLAALEADQ
jgi:hypothetical protein